MDYTEILGNNGPKYGIIWNGKKLIFSFLSDKQRAWLEVWMKQSKIDEINSENSFTEEGRIKQLDYFLSCKRAGDYKFGGKEHRRIMETDLGKQKFIEMLLIEYQPEITEKDVVKLLEDEPLRVACIFNLIMIESSAVKNNRGKALNIEEFYQKLVLPTDAGGLGIPLEIVAELTDKQKQALFTKDLQNKRSEVSQEDKKQMDTYVDQKIKELQDRGLAAKS